MASASVAICTPIGPALSLTRLHPLRETMAGRRDGHRVSADAPARNRTQITLASLPPYLSGRCLPHLNAFALSEHRAGCGSAHLGRSFYTAAAIQTTEMSLAGLCAIHPDGSLMTSKKPWSGALLANLYAWPSSAFWLWSCKHVGKRRAFAELLAGAWISNV